MLRQLFSSAALRPASRFGQVSGPPAASTSYLSARRQLSISATRNDNESNDASQAARSDANSVDSPASATSASSEAPAAAATSPASSRQAPAASLDDILASAASPTPNASVLPGMEDGTESSSQPSTSGFRGMTPIRPRIRSRSALADTPAHKLHVRTSRNNTILTLCSPEGDPLASASGGSVGFKKAARSGYEAGYRAAFNMFAKIGEKRDAWRILNLEILWNGFGQGREAVYRALLAGEGQATRQLVAKMTDKTPVKVGGVRPKKRRML